MTAPAAPPLVARVVPDVTGLDKQFDYSVPDALRDRALLGAMVRVPLHGRNVVGWVVRLGESDGTVAPERLLEVRDVVSHGPAADLVELSSWAALRWGSGRRRAFLVAASPQRRVRALPPAAATTGLARPAAEVPGDASIGSAADARTALAAGGGVVRIPPDEDPTGAILAAGVLGPVLVVTPSLETVGRLARRLRAAGRTVAVVPQDWARAAAGVDVTIGARAAAWAPCPAMAAAAVVDEHDERLQEERAPTWHARDVMRERARRAGIPLLLLSPAPSVVALVTGKVVVRPQIARERAGWPLVEILDRSDEIPWKRSLLSSALIRELRREQHRVVCVLNTLGRARLLACRACRALQRCTRCGAAVRQTDAGSLECPRCAETRPAVCQECAATGLSQIRQGVSRLRDDLAAASGRPVELVTGASAGDAGSPVAQGRAILVGTEAVLHRAERADTVAFVDFDSELLAPRYRAAEQAMALLVHAARLTGARAGGGRILVQTTLAHHEVLQAALLADPGRLATVETERRRDLGFPPFGALAWVGGTGAADVAGALAGDPRVVVGGTPADGYLVRAAGWRPLADAIAALPAPLTRRVRIEVDPPRR